MSTIKLLEPATAFALPQAARNTAATKRSNQTHSTAPLPLLVATDGTVGSDEAVRVGLALARRDGTEADMVAVFEPPVVYDAAPVYPSPAFTADLSRRGELCDRIEAQRHRIAPKAKRWPVRLEVGSPPQVIARIAKEKCQQLIVIGLDASAAREQYSWRETALKTIGVADVPVLAVAAGQAELPQRALVALDFTQSSLDAAQTALRLLGGSGTLLLVHVLPYCNVALGEPGFCGILYESEAKLLLDEAACRMQDPRGATVEKVLLRGEAAQTLLGFAGEQRIDLIAAGSHGRSGLARAILGSVSTKLLRSARCSVLVAPPNAKRVMAA